MHPMGKQTQILIPTLHYALKLIPQSIHMNLKGKTIKLLLQDDIREYLHNLRVGKDFLNKTKKTKQSTYQKEKHW